jgi:hypothetical protein
VDTPTQILSGPPVFRISDLSKTFPGTRALNGVNLDVRSGGVHALLEQERLPIAVLTKSVDTHNHVGQEEK